MCCSSKKQTPLNIIWPYRPDMLIELIEGNPIIYNNRITHVVNLRGSFAEPFVNITVTVSLSTDLRFWWRRVFIKVISTAEVSVKVYVGFDRDCEVLLDDELEVVGSEVGERTDAAVVRGQQFTVTSISLNYTRHYTQLPVMSVLHLRGLDLRALRTNFVALALALEVWPWPKSQSQHIVVDVQNSPFTFVKWIFQEPRSLLTYNARPFSQSRRWNCT